MRKKTPKRVKPTQSKTKSTTTSETKTKRVPVFYLKARTPVQQNYIDAIRSNDLTFGIGPAGVGKTFIVVALAVEALRDKVVSKIILVRPVVEAGERMGFLPGDMREKIDPYMRPFYDALYEMVGAEQTEEWLKTGVIEIAPLAFMRGRTLKDAFIIMDEAQNSTSEQLKMLLTRFGKGFKAVVTGDLNQIDLPVKTKSGLAEAARKLKNIDGIEFCHFTEADVVRHPLVQKIVHAYESEEDTV